ncbi:hypothetical protein ACFRDV_02610 [Streptomyces fagopyri]|uniref:hypothetical protein n=1 Tax=Streptomyces fagopyri TaxID=2662397 RepID=UPI0036880DDD
MPDPSWQAMRQAEQAQRIHRNHVRRHLDVHHMARARHTGVPHRYRPVSHGSVRGGVLGGVLLLVVVAAVLYVAHDPELRTTVETFARDMLSKVQSGRPEH